jgi:hypothetical protein
MRERTQCKYRAVRGYSSESYYVQIICERGIVLINLNTFTRLVTRRTGLPRSLRRATANFMQAY